MKPIFSTRIPEPVLAAVHSVADRKNITRSELIREILLKDDEIHREVKRHEHRQHDDSGPKPEA